MKLSKHKKNPVVLGPFFAENSVSESAAFFQVEIDRAQFMSDAWEKCGSTGCTVLLGTVKHGAVKRGQKIIISGYGDQVAISDQIARIEIDRQEVNEAKTDDDIGICLQYTRLDQFRRLRP